MKAARKDAAVTPTVAATIVASAVQTPRPDIPGSMGDTVFALLADDRLVAVRAHDGTVLAERALRPAPANTRDRATGHLLARSNDDSTLFALLTDDTGSPDQLVIVDVATTEVRASFPLATDGTQYRSIATGPVTGRLYLFGNRGADVIMSTVDPISSTTLGTWVAKEGGTHDWLVYQGAVSDDERQVLVSYHGTDTTGIDWFTVTADGPQRCEIAVRPNTGCLRTHGGFILDNGELLAATGTRIIVAVDETGAIKYGLDTYLEGNHLMEFVVDKEVGRLYAVGSCGYTGGFSVLDIRRDSRPAAVTQDGIHLQSPPPPPQVFVPPRAPDGPRTPVPCGERLTLGANGLVVVGRTEKPVASSNIPGALLFLDGRTGQVIRAVRTPSEPVDVLDVLR